MRENLTPEFLNQAIVSVLYPAGMSPAERFWKYVDRRGDDECWAWTGSLSKQGYGRLGISGCVYLASRIAYAIANGYDLPVGLFACHKCDNPACCNPGHIYAGTYQDNVDDATARNRRPLGVNRRSSKLNDDLIREIRARHQSGESLSSLSRAFQTTPHNIALIVRRETWRHVGDSSEVAA